MSDQHSNEAQNLDRTGDIHKDARPVVNQNFNGPVGNVTGSGNVLPGTAGVLLVELRWTSRSYPFPRFLSARVLAFSIGTVAFLTFALPCWFLWAILLSLPTSGFLRFEVAIAFAFVFWVLAMYLGLIAWRIYEVAEAGFYPVTRLSGYLRELDGRVSRVELGGAGTICAYEWCGGHLKFVTMISKTFLQCERNSDHCWKFDHTSVSD